MPDYLEPLVWLLVLIPLFYLWVPLIVMGRHRMPAHPPIQELELKTLPPDVAAFLMAKTRELFDLGFDEPSLVQIPDPAPNVNAYLALVVNRRAGDKAVVTTLVGHTQLALKAFYVEFGTRFDDDRVIHTLNLDDLSAFPPPPTVVRTQTPSVTNVRELYELHRYMIQKHVDVRGRPVVYPPGKAKEYLAEYAFERVYADLARRGWLVFDEPTDSYRPTLSGAYRITCGLLQPFKWFRMLAMRAREKQILQEFRRSRQSA
jgi:hypothetical protein